MHQNRIVPNTDGGTGPRRQEGHHLCSREFLMRGGQVAGKERCRGKDQRNPCGLCGHCENYGNEASRNKVHHCY